MCQRDPAVRIEDDAHRVRSRAGAHRQLGIVRDGGARPDDHRVGQGAKTVQMAAVLLAGDIVGVTGPGRDETVQALSELREGEARTGQAHRQIAVGEQPRLGRGGTRPPPFAVRPLDQTGGPGIRLGPDGAQPLPCQVRLQHTHRSSSAPTTERYSANASTSPASSSFPFTAEALEGRPMTPDSV